MPASVRFRDYLLLLVVLLLGYWMVLVYILPNDNLDCWLPWRHFISKGFHNGMVPLWNPYLQLGYPVYADLQGPFFSLENFLTGTLFTTNLTVLQSILFTYVFVGAIGMYELGNHLFKHRHIPLMVALAYAMGGFFTHHLQHFFTIISVSLLPFTLLMVLRFLQDPKWKYIFALGLLLHLSVTAGNQTFNIINLHFMAVFFIRAIVLYFKKHENKKAWVLVRQSFFLVLVVLLTISPVLVAFWQSKAYVYRYGGIEYTASIAGSMTTTGLLSFINPFLTTQSFQYLGTDPSMAGYFMGFIMLVFALVFFVFSKGVKKWIFFFTAVVFTLLSLGQATPVHGWAYQIDPLLRLFRCPSYFMFYAYFILVLSAGYGLVLIFEQKVLLKKVLLVSVAVVMPVLAMAFAQGFGTGKFFADLEAMGAFGAVQQMPLETTFGFSALLMLVTGVLSLVLFAWKKKKTLLLAGLILELVITTNVFMLRSLMPEPASTTDAFIASLPKGYALPPNALGLNADLKAHLPKGTWRNFHGYFNVVSSSEFFNSFYTNIIDWEQDSTLQKQKLWQNRREHSVKLKQFEPGLMVFETPLGKREKLQINQLKYPYWTLYFDGHKVPLNGKIIMEMDAPAGTKEIKLVFENPVMLVLFWCALGITALLVLLLLVSCLPRMAGLVSGFVFAVFCAATVWLFLSGNKAHAPANKTVLKKSGAQLVINKGLTEPIDSTGIYDARFELDNLLHDLLTAEGDMTCIDSGNFNPPVIKKALEARFRKIKEEKIGHVIQYHASHLNKAAGVLLGGNDWNVPAPQVVYDSLAQTNYCLLSTQHAFGASTQTKVPAGHRCFFALQSVHETRVAEGELLVVMDILRGNKSLVYEGKPLTASKNKLVFYPDYVFKGDETVKIYYWLNGRGEARIYAASVYVVPYK